MTQPTTKDARNTLPSQQKQPPPELTSVAEKTLPSKCKDGSLLTYCPTMDLIALATEDEQLYVYRLNGQEVLSADLAGDPYLDEVKGEIRGVRWKNDGNLFPHLMLKFVVMSVRLKIYCRSLVSSRRCREQTPHHKLLHRQNSTPLLVPTTRRRRPFFQPQ